MRTLCRFGMGLRYMAYTYVAEKMYASKVVKSDTLPLLKEAIRQLQGDGTIISKRVTVFAVERMLHLPGKQISLCLPQCLAEIQKHEESQEQYWAREVVWAVNQLRIAGIPLVWRRIRDLTNMQPQNFRECLPYVSDCADEITTIHLRSIGNERDYEHHITPWSVIAVNFQSVPCHFDSMLIMNKSLKF